MLTLLYLSRIEKIGDKRPGGPQTKKIVINDQDIFMDMRKTYINLKKVNLVKRPQGSVVNMLRSNKSVQFYLFEPDFEWFKFQRVRIHYFGLDFDAFLMLNPTVDDIL